MIRPQPVGLTPWPHGGLLLPAVPGAVEFAAALVTRGEDPDPPAGLEFWVEARADRLDAAVAALDDHASSGEDRHIVEYNRFVLRPDAARLEALRGASLDPGLATLVEVAAYHAGLVGDLAGVDALDGELAAFASAVAATRAVENGRMDEAASLLEQAAAAAGAQSPGLAAQLRLSVEELERGRGHGLGESSIERLRAALAELPATGFTDTRAEIQLELAGVLQEVGGPERGRLTEIVGLLQDCLRILDRTRHRRAHGFAQMRLGLAYLSMPMQEAGDALRMGVATQALRESVRVLSPDEEPELWCSAATNLANAYQVLPSGHLAENLEAAIGLYDRVLALRDAAAMPVAHARGLINRANARASLERFQPAIDDLRQAVPLLQQSGLTDEARHTQRMVDDLIRAQTGLPESGVAAMRIEDGGMES